MLIYYTDQTRMRRKEAACKPDSDTAKHQVPNINVRTPRKPDPQSQHKKVHQTPIKNLDPSEEILSLSDKQQLLLLEIQQLKRENNFLKKKISQLAIETTDRYGPKRASNKQKRPASPACAETVSLSVEGVFQEIRNVLNTIVKLFRLQLSEKEMQDYNKAWDNSMKERCPVKKHLLFKKSYLKQKLERVMLEREEDRFPILVELFGEYYKTKEDYENTIVKTIENLTVKTHELNQSLLRKVQDRKKSKGTFSTIKQDQQERIPIETLKSPSSSKNFVAQNKLMVNSPLTNRNGKKQNRFPVSPSEKPRHSDV